MKSSLIKVKIGDLVKEIESGREGVLVDISLVPNGINAPELVAILFVKTDNGIVSATSNRFTIVREGQYKEFYPSVHLNHLTTAIK